MSKTRYVNPRIDQNVRSASAATGKVSADPVKIAWVGSMFMLGALGSLLAISWAAIGLFVVSTIVTLCLGHSLGMHRLFIHRSYRAPKWLEYLLVHLFPPHAADFSWPTNRPESRS